MVITSFALGLQAQDGELERLPDELVTTLDGDKLNIAEYGENGKITVISFWATWCAPCKKELNNISDIYPDWQDAYDVELVAVSVDDARDVAKVKPYINGQGWEFEVLSDPNQDLQRALNFQSVPYTIVVDHEGDIMYEHNGYVEGDEYELEEVIQTLAESMEE